MAYLVTTLKMLLGGLPGCKDAEMKELKEWFEKSTQSLQVQAEHNPLASKGNREQQLPKLLLALRCSVLDHQWTNVARILSFIAKFPAGSSYTFARVGMEAYIQYDGEPSAFLNQFISQAKNCREPESRKNGITVLEITLQYFVFLLSELQVTEALTAKQVTTRQQLKKDASISKKTNLELKAYEGMAYYLQWLILKTKLKEEAEGADSFHQSEDLIATSDDKLQQYANKAIKCYENLQEQEGVWDIFIYQYAELLVYTEQVPDAEKVLKTYADKNFDNPFALRNLYKFYIKHDYGTDVKINVLETLCNHVPSDKLVLDLVELYGRTEKDPKVSLNKSLPLLFSMLDYACWQDRDESWAVFATHLLNYRKKFKSKSTKILKNLWEKRDSWWPSYHFDVELIEESSISEIFVTKALVAAILIGTDNDFTKKVMLIAEKSDIEKTNLEDLKTVLNTG